MSLLRVELLTDDPMEVLVDEEVLPFFSEVEVLAAPGRNDLVGRVGAVLGVSDDVDEGQRHYAIQLDGHESVISFSRAQLRPTGGLRRREDYY